MIARAGIAALLLAACGAVSVGTLHAEEPAPALATCAAYFFNATRARPMNEYEALYSAGERLANHASGRRTRNEVDRQIAEASVVMTQMTGGDWREFDRVSARYHEQCLSLLGELDGAAASR